MINANVEEYDWTGLAYLTVLNGAPILVGCNIAKLKIEVVAFEFQYNGEIEVGVCISWITTMVRSYTHMHLHFRFAHARPVVIPR
jgi:hypothetical protein